MILENLTKEKASEIIEKGKVIGTLELGASEFNTYYYLNNEVRELSKGEYEEEMETLRLIDIPKPILLNLMKEDFFTFDKEEKIKLIEKLDSLINCEKDKKDNISIDTEYDICMNGLWLSGRLKAENVFKLNKTSMHMNISKAGILIMAVDSRIDSAGIVHERLDERTEVFKICSCIDDDNYMIITIVVYEALVREGAKKL